MPDIIDPSLVTPVVPQRIEVVHVSCSCSSYLQAIHELGMEKSIHKAHATYLNTGKVQEYVSVHGKFGLLSYAKPVSSYGVLGYMQQEGMVAANIEELVATALSDPSIYDEIKNGRPLVALGTIVDGEVPVLRGSQQYDGLELNRGELEGGGWQPRARFLAKFDLSRLDNARFRSS